VGELMAPRYLKGDEKKTAILVTTSFIKNSSFLVYAEYRAGACSRGIAQLLTRSKKRYSMLRPPGARFTSARHGVWHMESITSLILNEIRWSGPRVRVIAYALCNIQAQLPDRQNRILLDPDVPPSG
jgi:hypothetical protein